MHDAGQQQVLEIRENVFQRFRVLRRTRRQGRQNRAGLGARGNPPGRNVVAVIRDPVRDLVKVPAKNIRRDVAEFVHGGT